MSSESWSGIVDLNLTSVFHTIQAAVPLMRRRKYGRIIVTSSVAGLRGEAVVGYAYSATKAGLIHLTRCLAVALAPDVLVNCVAPGLIEGTRIAGRLPDGVRETALQRAVLRRGTSAQDVAEQVVTFCSTDSTTGQVLAVDAGFVFH